MSFLEKIINNLIDITLGKASRSRGLSSIEEDHVVSQWKKVIEQVKSGNPSALKQAVISADKLTDFTLKCLVTGETMGERLKKAKDLFDYEVYDSLWKAHKVRNALVHDTSYDPPHYVVKEAVDQFAEALKVLGVRIR